MKNTLQLIKSNERVQNLLTYLALSQDEIDNSLVRAAWWLAVLFHDVGYAYDLVRKLEDKIEQMYPFHRKPPISPNDEDLKGIDFEHTLLYSFLHKEAFGNPKDSGELNNDEKDYRFRYICSIVENDMNLNHGIIGALFLHFALHEHEQYASYPSRAKLILNLAAEAILMHEIIYARQTSLCQPLKYRDLNKGGLRFDAKEMPLGCLLILCDESQERARLSLQPIDYRRDPNKKLWLDNSRDPKIPQADRFEYEERTNTLRFSKEFSEKYRNQGKVLSQKNRFRISALVHLDWNNL